MSSQLNVSIYAALACSGQLAGKADLPTGQDICWWPGVSCLGKGVRCPPS